jgi:DNA ligase-associated metallophosphoesterase
MNTELVVNGVRLVADTCGALIWPDAATLAVADLHLEKGSAYARRGTLLPPYDSRATLDSLTALIARERPRRVICLGDSFHDLEAAERIDPGDAIRLADLTKSVEWIWVLGNHDPKPSKDAPWTGRVETNVTLGALTFRHEAAPQNGTGEVSGHFHPKAAIHTRARRVTGRCFVSDGRRLILPAFGAYAGGLDVLDPAISGLFGGGFQAYLIGRTTVRPFPRDRLSPL